MRPRLHLTQPLPNTYVHMYARVCTYVHVIYIYTVNTHINHIGGLIALTYVMYASEASQPARRERSQPGACIYICTHTYSLRQTVQVAASQCSECAEDVRLHSPLIHSHLFSVCLSVCLSASLPSPCCCLLPSLACLATPLPLDLRPPACPPIDLVDGLPLALPHSFVPMVRPSPHATRGLAAGGAFFALRPRDYERSTQEAYVRVYAACLCEKGLPCLAETCHDTFIHTDPPQHSDGLGEWVASD